MSHYHYGDDGDLWVYPPPNEWGDAPEHIEAVRLECQLFVDADDSIAQVRRLQAENAELQALCKSMRCALVDFDDKVYLAAIDNILIGLGFDLKKLGIEVKDDAR